MPRPAAAPGPSGGGGDTAAAWLVPGAAALVLLAAGALWAGGGVASLLAGHGWRSAPFRPASLGVFERRGVGGLWPGVDPRLVLGLSAGLLLAVLAPLGVWVMLRLSAPLSPAASLARRRHLTPMHGKQAAGRARLLRPAVAQVRRLPADDAGVPLGRLGRTPVVASWEDVALAVMAPRSGKTTALAIPATLAAPGAVVVTANKADSWAATAALRERETGERVWTFDPQAVAHAPQEWFWDPLAGLDTVEEAERLAGHFVGTVDDGRADLWGPAATSLLSALLLAAAASGGTLLDVYRWLADSSATLPVTLLRNCGQDALADELQATIDGAAETRDSIFITARTAARCLRNPAITAWVTPPAADRPLARFDPAAVPGSRQTVYLLSKDGGGSAAPLVAALTDRIVRCGIRAAEAAGGRLDPPMLLVLDEAANICRIADLPALYSHLGSRGIVPLTILQSYRQGVGVWGDVGMAALWGAATVKLIGPGMDDADFAEDLSRLVGDHDVTTTSYSSGGGPASRTRSTRQERVLPASAIRALPKGSALLLATGTKVAMLTLVPVYAGPRAAEVAAATAAAQNQITAAASSSRSRVRVAM